MKHLEGGCQLPLGCYAHASTETTLRLTLQLIAPDASQEVVRQFLLPINTSLEDLEQTAINIAEEVLNAGGSAIKLLAQEATNPSG